MSLPQSHANPEDRDTKVGAGNPESDGSNVPDQMVRHVAKKHHHATVVVGASGSVVPDHMEWNPGHATGRVYTGAHKKLARRIENRHKPEHLEPGQMVRSRILPEQ